MLRRVVHWVVAGVALTLALHLYMLSGHSHQADGPPSRLGAAAHQGAAAAHRQDMAGEIGGPVRTVDMLATCLAIVGTLLLGTVLGRGIRPAAPPVQMAVPKPSGLRDPPRARSPVELCVSRR